MSNSDSTSLLGGNSVAYVNVDKGAAVNAAEGDHHSHYDEDAITHGGGGIFDRLLPHGSLAASGFNLASATLGAGTLALPAAFKASGALLASIFLILCCSATVYSISLLIVVLEHTDCKTYEEIAHKLVGKWFERLTAFLIVAFCWGITIVYVVAMGDILDPLRNISGFPEALRGEWGRRAITTIFWGLFMLPLSLMREINSLRYASVIGMFSTAILVSAIIVHAARDDAQASAMPIAKFDIDMVIAMPLCIFSYCCQTNAFEIYAEMKDRSIRRMTKASGVSMTVCTIIYIIAGTAGLADFGDKTDGNVLKNYKNPEKVAYLAVAFVAISITLTMAFPICIFPTRDAVLQLMGFKDAYHTPTRVRLIVAGLLAVLSLIAGLFVPGVSVLFGVLGGICGSTLAFIWPAIFVLKTGEWTVEKAGWAHVIATWALLICGVLAGVLGTAVSLYQQFS